MDINTFDPQRDEMQIVALSMNFHPLDMPKRKFVTGAQERRLYRSKQADPKPFGIFKTIQLDLEKGDMVRDFLALNKIEILPWDNFKLIKKPFRSMNAHEKSLMDRLAHISSGDDRDFVLLRAAFTANREQLLPKYFK